ncbi:MAG: hypothetical protein LUD84_06495 [Clostridiales bacterium]|nr:hypothetical protein [Clostridiales bacterium]
MVTYHGLQLQGEKVDVYSSPLAKKLLEKGYTILEVRKNPQNPSKQIYTFFYNPRTRLKIEIQNYQKHCESSKNSQE